MKNKNKYVLLGRIFIVIAFIILLFTLIYYLFFSNNKSDIDSAIKVTTSEKNGISIKNDNYDYYKSSDDFAISYIKDINLERRNKYSFPYPETLIDKYYSEFTKVLKNDEIMITSNNYVDFNLESYIENLKKEYQSYSYSQFNYSKIKNVKISGYDVNYFKIEAFSNLDKIEGAFGNNKYFENFVVVINCDELSVVISYVTFSKRFSDEFLSDIINKIEIEKNAATYLSSSKVDGMLTGSLKLMDIFENHQVYELNYQINANEFYEVEDIRNNYDTLVLSSKDNEVFITMQLVQYDLENFDLIVEEYLKKYFEGYKILNFTNRDITDNKINYKIISFNPKMSDKSELQFYKQFFHKIDDKVYVIISCSSKNKIDDGIILKNFVINGSVSKQ